MLELSLVERSSLSRRIHCTAWSTHSREEVRGGGIITGKEEEENSDENNGWKNR